MRYYAFVTLCTSLLLFACDDSDIPKYTEAQADSLRAEIRTSRKVIDSLRKQDRTVRALVDSLDMSEKKP